MALEFLENALLRTAIRRNLVSFPSQIRPFTKRNAGNLQARIVQLYFLRGWAVRSICERYRLRKHTVHRLLAQWRVRAIESGYIQEIEAGSLSVIFPDAQKAADILDDSIVDEVRGEAEKVFQAGWNQLNKARLTLADRA